MKRNNKKTILIIFLSIVFLILITYACYKIIPLFISLKEPKNQEKFKNYIKGLGWKGWITVLTIQVLQTFIAFIPGEIVEVLCGILYGSIGGLLTCLFGMIIGSILIYYTMKLFANKSIIKYREKLKTYNFLKDPKKVSLYLFILFFIPGLPKDIFIYLVPFLPIKFITFLIISSIARIPSILSSTIIGDSLVKGNYITSIIIFIVFAILGVLSILFNDKIIALFSKNNKKTNNSDKLEN
jgi:uncharacterized membrane protein YdjX (TVP38/TMEM64 family)